MLLICCIWDYSFSGQHWAFRSGSSATLKIFSDLSIFMIVLYRNWCDKKNSIAVLYNIQENKIVEQDYEHLFRGFQKFPCRRPVKNMFLTYEKHSAITLR